MKSQAKLGGWSCWGTGRNLDSWEALSAFAVYPREKWTKEMKEAVEKGAEFFLERELYKQGEHYEPWYRFHYPVHYYYDLLVGLDFMTALGYGQDKRLGHALNVLKKKKYPKPAAGTWMRCIRTSRAAPLTGTSSIPSRRPPHSRWKRLASPAR